MANEAEDRLAANRFAQSRDEVTSRTAALCDKATIVGQASEAYPRRLLLYIVDT